MADIVIVGALVFGAIAGWRKGFVLPLIALGGAVLSIAALYAGPLNGIVPSGTAGLGVGAVALFLGGTILGRIGAVLVGLVYKVAVLRRVDQIVGIPLGTAMAAVAVYVAVLGTLALDGWLSPLKAKATAATSSPVAADQLAKFDATLAFYEQTVPPELLQSRIVPVFLVIGESLPFIGRHAELPTH